MDDKEVNACDNSYGERIIRGGKTCKANPLTKNKNRCTRGLVEM